VRWIGGALGSTVDRGRHGHRVRRRLVGTRHAGARARQSSSAVAKGYEGDEVVLEGCSPEHERL
jgi:hypothetical protein